MSVLTLSKTIPVSIQKPEKNSYSLFFDTDGKLKFKDSLNDVYVVGNDTVIDLSGKLDKVVSKTPTTQVYAKNANGTQTMIDITQITNTYSKDYSESFQLQASNISGDIVTVAVGNIILVNRRLDAFLNGVLIHDDMVSIADGKTVTLDLSTLDVAPRIGDSVIVKYISQA